MTPSAGSPTSTGSQTTCVVVVGANRSGTSATAGMLVALGLTPPGEDDIVPANSSNERGHWESRTVIGCNTRLLQGVGSSPYAPPEPILRWDLVPGFDATRAKAARWYESTFNGNALVVKDPRMCMTLAFWRDVVPARMAAVFVLRDPLRVARSLESRDGLPMSLGLASWDRYMRSAAVGLEGLPTLVVEYDAMLEDPERASTEITGFLRDVGIEAAPDAAAAGSSWLDPSLRHQQAAVDQYADQASVQREIFAELCSRVGYHESWHAPSSFPPAQLWVDDVIALRQAHGNVRRELRVLRSTPLNRMASGVRRLTRRPLPTEVTEG